MKNQLPIQMIGATEHIELIVNGIKCIEIDYPDFIVYAQENPFPFLVASYNNIRKHWMYKSIVVCGKFYAPTLNK